MRILFSFLLVILVFSGHAQFKVEDYYKDSFKGDWGKAFSACFKAMDEKGSGSLDLSGGKYIVRSNIELPRAATAGKRMFVVNGNGSMLIAKVDTVCIFNRIPKSQNEALSKMMKTRFTINDITFIGGAKGINLGATYQSSINRCNFQSHKVAAIDIQFGLHTSINHCNTIGCKKDNYVLRTGEDWGGSKNNSQSNHSVINQSRVYAAAGAKTAFKVLGSGGVVIRDVISEGSKDIDYSVFVDRQTSTTVRLFKLENFHLEHKPLKAGIYISSTGINTIDGVFYQLSYEGFRLLHTGSGTNQVTLKNVPHYVTGTIIQQDWTQTAWLLESCNKKFFNPDNWRVKKGAKYESKLPFYFKGNGYGPSIEKNY